MDLGRQRLNLDPLGPRRLRSLQFAEIRAIPRHHDHVFESNYGLFFRRGEGLQKRGGPVFEDESRRSEDTLSYRLFMVSPNLL